ncbi:TolC family protein [Alistipes sp.]|uniref:TolC family protein n=1 Tax=Alistipes sp. TaxID=1872444 RepID=UPI003AF136D2
MKKSLLLALVLPIFWAAQGQHRTPGSGALPAAEAQSPAYRPNVSQALLTDMSVESYANLHLPPLHVLLENARERSSQVNMFAAKTEEQERELKTLRRSWLKFLKINSSFSYGTTDTNSEFYYDSNLPVVQNVTGMTRRWWNVGASFNLPLDEIFNRRNKIKQQQRRIASIRYETDSWYDEICLSIIDCYTTAIQYLAVLKDTSQALIIAQAQYEATEADFVNGKVDAVALSRQRNISNESFRMFQETRAKLNKALLQLEVLSKTPIISQPQQQPAEMSKNAKP